MKHFKSLKKEKEILRGEGSLRTLGSILIIFLLFKRRIPGQKEADMKPILADEQNFF